MFNNPTPKVCALATIEELDGVPIAGILGISIVHHADAYFCIVGNLLRFLNLKGISKVHYSDRCVRAFMFLGETGNDLTAAIVSVIDP